jgi:hypothetical protein
VSACAPVAVSRIIAISSVPLKTNSGAGKTAPSVRLPCGIDGGS